MGQAELGRKRYRSCALVGNAGHLINHQYGPYIDRHEAVIRFNVLVSDMPAVFWHHSVVGLFSCIHGYAARASRGASGGETDVRKAIASFPEGSRCFRGCTSSGSMSGSAPPFAS